ncbi:hypothetical protein MKK63_11895 [Methylobacterium sp. J-088]|uniref:hypothetical protein n=1 Tax=Methylobacterium sp. J-088 TaxID=2836664 RepID=UPI001FBAE79B|nr:hypothetical protein [Methylobacterium sp. J-088]MCJ2063409.1 hypothetical protein [Methylobacterium sp. J-088]
MSLRTTLQKLIRRDPGPLSLRERADELRDAFSSPNRRAIVAGSLAAAVPLPALAAPVTAVPAQQHPDAELLAAWDKYQQADAAYVAATEANSDAWRALRYVRPPIPEVLRLTPSEKRRFTSGLHYPLGHVATRIRWPDNEGGQPDQFWMGAGLRKAITGAVKVFGRGGQTPNRIRRWRDLLPVADAYDERYSALEARFRCRELREAKQAAEEARTAASICVGELPATTPEGLAIKVRYVSRGSGWHTMHPGWTTLVQAAASISGVTLPAPRADD